MHEEHSQGGADSSEVLLSSLSLVFPQWFCDSAALDTDDSLERQKVYKFRADLAVRQGNYQVTVIAIHPLFLIPMNGHYGSSVLLSDHQQGWQKVTGKEVEALCLMSYIHLHCISQPVHSTGYDTVVMSQYSNVSV